MLVDEQGNAPAESDPVQLSSATEALLGNILEPGQRRRRHTEEDDDETVVGPPPQMDEVPAEQADTSDTRVEAHDQAALITDDEMDVTETTVSTAFVQGREVTLSKPLASLGPTSSDESGVDDPEINAVTHKRLPRISRRGKTPAAASAVQTSGSAQQASGGERPGVFTGLDLEVERMGADVVSDDAVTRRVERKDGRGRERTGESTESAPAASSMESMEQKRPLPERPMPVRAPSEKIELEAGLEELGGDTAGAMRSSGVDGDELVASEDTLVAERPSRESLMAPSPEGVSEGLKRVLWTIAIVVLAALAGVVWFMALT